MTTLASSALLPPHSRTLGVCWLIYGIFRVVTAVWLAAFTATATVMFGALLVRVPEPFSLMADFHLLYLAVLIWAGISGVMALLAGVAMLTGHRAAGGLARLAAYLCVGDAPLGTTLGVYTLTVLRPTIGAEAAMRAQRAA
jgi:hypothetical protein